MDLPGVEKDPLGRGCFAGVNMRDDTNISQFADGHERLAPLGVPSSRFQVPSESQNWIVYIKTGKSVQGKMIGITVEVEVEVEVEDLKAFNLYLYLYFYRFFLCTLHPSHCTL